MVHFGPLYFSISTPKMLYSRCNHIWLSCDHSCDRTLVHDTHQCSFPLHETALPLLWDNLRPNQQFAGSFIPVVRSLPSSHPHFRAPTEACSGSCCEDLAFADSDAIFCLVESFLCSQNQSYQGCGYLLDHFSKFLPSVASAIPSSCTENFMQD